jgi:DNA-binding protein YbaB
VVAPDDSTLSQLFPELTGLRQEAAVLAARLNAAGAAAAETSGRDASEQVRVVLTPAGRVASVEVGASWRGALDAAAVGPAVLEAYRDAGVRRTEAWADAVSHGAVPVEPAPDQGQPTPSNPAIPDHDALRKLWYLLQDATDRLTEVIDEAAARTTAAVLGHDPGEHATATLTGGALTAVELDERWLAEADGRQIGTAVGAAIADGYATIDQLAATAVTSQWPFPDLDRLTGDPASLLSSLGLPAPARTDRDSGGDRRAAE